MTKPLTSHLGKQKKNELLNPKKEPLTPGKLRELTGKEYTDEQADKIITSIRLYAKVLFGLMNKSPINQTDKAEVVSIYNTKKAA